VRIHNGHNKVGDPFDLDIQMDAECKIAEQKGELTLEMVLKMIKKLPNHSQSKIVVHCLITQEPKN